MTRHTCLFLFVSLLFGCGGAQRCPAGQTWNDCAHGSCDVCRDCVGECEDSSSSGQEVVEPAPASEEGPSCGAGRCAPDETCINTGDPSCPECDVLIPTCTGPRGNHGTGPAPAEPAAPAPQAGDCPAGQRWDECVRASCDVCLDCIGGCVNE